MKTIHTLLCFAAIASLAGCQARTPEPAAQQAAASTAAGTGTISKAMDEAAKKLATENITIRSDDGESHKAEITPAGDLLIDGRKIAIDDSQRRLLLDYRARVNDIAQAGMKVGAAGAELAGQAVTDALGSLFSGNPDDIGKRIEAHADGIKSAARGLCDSVPALQEAQRKAAEAIPEFAPFAKQDRTDAEHCRQEIDAHDAPTPPAPASTPSPTASTTDA